MKCKCDAFSIESRLLSTRDCVIAIRLLTRAEESAALERLPTFLARDDGKRRMNCAPGGFQDDVEYAAAAQTRGRSRDHGEMDMIAGSCLCGRVRYAVDGRVGEIVHCHCRTCRKAHGSAFSSVAAVRNEDFSLHDKEGMLKAFESSPGKRRWFCSNCGTQVYARKDDSSYIILRLGSLDVDPQARERAHIWVAQKASWYTIGADLPQFAEFEVH